MFYELLIRGTDLLQEITPVAGTYYTVGEDTPQQQQDFEGYVAWWGDPTWTQDFTNSDQRRFVVTMPGYLQSPQALTGNHFTRRTDMMRYADLITQKFIERSRLELNGQALAGVQEGTGFTGGNIRAVPFPDSNNQIIRYRYTFTLTVIFLRSKVC